MAITDANGRPLGEPTRQDRRRALRETSFRHPDAYPGVLARLLLSDRDDLQGFLEGERSRRVDPRFCLQGVCDVMAQDVVTLLRFTAAPANREVAALEFLTALSGLVREYLNPEGARTGEPLAAAPGESGEAA